MELQANIDAVVHAPNPRRQPVAVDPYMRNTIDHHCATCHTALSSIATVPDTELGCLDAAFVYEELSV